MFLTLYPKKFASKIVSWFDDKVAVMASPLDVEIVADVVASSDMEDEEPRKTLA